MKVFLIQLPNIVSEAQARQTPPYLAVGLGILASTLRNEGHQVRLLDAYTEGWEHRARIENDWIEIGLAEEEIAAQVRHFQPQVVGFSLPFSSMLPRLRTLARWVKAIHPEIYVVCGGNHATCAPEEVLSLLDVEAVVLGEAERSFPQLLQALEHDDPLENLPGLGLRDQSGHINIVPATEIITDLEALPHPAFDLLPLKKYFKAVGSRTMPLLATRGCQGTCANCSQTANSRGRVRCFSPEYVCGMMRHLAEFYGVREFTFDDHGLFSEAQIVGNLCDRLISEKLNVHWSARGDVDPALLDDALLAKMRRSGGRALHFSIGSASRRVLHRVLKKKLDLYVLEEAMSRALVAGFEVSCEFLLGSPGESVEEVYDTLNFAWKLRSRGVEAFSFLLSTPYVGTDLRRQAAGLEGSAPASDPQSATIPNPIAGQDLLRMEMAQIRDTAQREFNSRGLVLELSKLVGAAKSGQRVEERFFATVAPWPSRRRTSKLSPDREPAAQ